MEVRKVEGKGKSELAKTFPYEKLRNVEYEDSDWPNLILDVESSGGTRCVLVDEGNPVAECCSPKTLQKDIQKKNNVIVSLRPYVTRELMVTETETPPKKSRKSKPEHKKYQKRQKPYEDELEMLEFVKEEERSNKWKLLLRGPKCH